MCCPKAVTPTSYKSDFGSLANGSIGNPLRARFPGVVVSTARQSSDHTLAPLYPFAVALLIAVPFTVRG